MIEGMNKLDVTRRDHQVLGSTTMSMEELWNQRYGHLNHNDLTMFIQKKGMVEGLLIHNNKHLECEGCALGKKHRDYFPTHRDKRK
jgi:hypothetical protein